MAKAKKKEAPKGPATIENRRARHDYLVSDTVEAGMVLKGSEVKSLFAGRANLSDAYCRVMSGELWLYGLDIEPYSHTALYQPQRKRDVKLLVHRREIAQLDRQVMEKNMSLVPLKIYFSNGRAKCLVGIAQGKKQYDKREALKQRETKREMEREGLR